MQKRSLTGDRPTGRLHLGHYVGSLKKRVELQKLGYDQFVMIADVQALSANAKNPEIVRKNVVELAMDYCAVGLDPKKTTFFIQSLVPEIAELTMYFLNLVSISRIGQNPTVKTEIKEKGFGGNVPAGFFIHPINQAADILIFRPDVVPVGEDQLPMIEQANELAEKFNNTYSSVFKKVKPLVSDVSRLVGIDGKAKMSKSLGNAIFLSDSRKEIQEKVKKMYTDPNHIHVSDPGKIDGNVVFKYLDLFDKDKEELKKLKKHYQKGGLGDVEIKGRLINVLDETISEIREKREKLEKNPNAIMKILQDGTNKARGEALKTICLVKKAMHINYF